MSALCVNCTGQVSSDYRLNPESFLTNLMLLTSFAKVGREQILGLPPKPPIRMPLMPEEDVRHLGRMYLQIELF